MANWYASSVGYTAVAQFAINTAYVSTSNGGRGDYVRQLAAPAVGNERVFRCTTSGTSAGSEPSWTLTKNGTTTSNTAVFTECTGAEAEQATNAWKAPHARIANAAAWMAAGDKMFVASAHAETSSAVIEPVSPGVGTSMICVNAAGSVPPVAADMTTGASVTTTSGQTIRIDGYWDIYGMTFTSAATSACWFGVFSSTNAYQRYTNCAIVGGSQGVLFGNNNGFTVDLENTTIDAGGTAVVEVRGDVIWRNTPSALAGSPNSVIYLWQFTTGNAYFEGLDLSAKTTGMLFNAGTSIVGSAVLKDCKLSSGPTGIVRLGASGVTADCINCYDGTGQYKRARDNNLGIVRTSTSLYRTGGAADTGGYSYKVDTNANAAWTTPLEAPPGMVWCGSTGVNVNVTGYGIINSASLPNNDGIWFDVEYMGSASLRPGYYASGTKATPLTSNAALTADTSAWDAGITARQNTHAYSLGDQIKVATNPGRVFFCTTAGTTAGSEPGGYATAVDGGSVTDSGAVFRAGQRFRATVALTSPQPAAPGLVQMTWKAATASSTFWLDPRPLVV